MATLEVEPAAGANADDVRRAVKTACGKQRRGARDCGGDDRRSQRLQVAGDLTSAGRRPPCLGKVAAAHVTGTAHCPAGDCKICRAGAVHTADLFAFRDLAEQFGQIGSRLLLAVNSSLVPVSKARCTVRGQMHIPAHRFSTKSPKHPKDLKLTGTDKHLG